MKIIKSIEAPRDIKNLGSLARGTGARFLECIKAHNGDLVASQWRRKEPKQYEVLIDYLK